MSVLFHTSKSQRLICLHSKIHRSFGCNWIALLFIVHYISKHDNIGNSYLFIFMAGWGYWRRRIQIMKKNIGKIRFYYALLLYSSSSFNFLFFLGPWTNKINEKYVNILNNITDVIWTLISEILFTTYLRYNNYVNFRWWWNWSSS